jgi:cobalt-zinc-cadmium efflux system membrane fusion protein
MPVVQKGQQIQVSVMAFPNRTFEGRISTVGSTVDPQLHRGLVRAEIDDSKHELLPGMLANFVIYVGDPVTTVAVPLASVVREGDGTMTVWVTTDRRHFTQRKVTLGLQSNGYDQVIDGLKSGEVVATDGAVFLDNMLTPSDAN